MPKKITCKPHPMSGASEGPVVTGPDEAEMECLNEGKKTLSTLVIGDKIRTYDGGPFFEVEAIEDV